MIDTRHAFRHFAIDTLDDAYFRHYYAATMALRHAFSYDLLPPCFHIAADIFAAAIFAAIITMLPDITLCCR